MNNLDYYTMYTSIPIESNPFNGIIYLGAFLATGLFISLIVKEYMSKKDETPERQNDAYSGDDIPLGI